MRHGWFVIPGVQTGDRTLAEQALGVERALGECVGKTVLDLGCAEGLLARSFSLAGAARVHGIDSVGGHLQVAMDICSRYRTISFEQADLHEPPPLTEPFDIVLALGIAHKLKHPEELIRYAADASRGLVLVRMTKYSATGLLRSKFFPQNVCNVTEEMTAKGFALETIESGPREETVHYYRRAIRAR